MRQTLFLREQLFLPRTLFLGLGLFLRPKPFLWLEPPSRERICFPPHSPQASRVPAFLEEEFAPVRYCLSSSQPWLARVLPLPAPPLPPLRQP